jgi:hypothetical protein
VTIHRCLFVESIGDQVKSFNIGRYTLTLSSRHLCLFIESVPNRHKAILSASHDVILARAS